jgi:hypothetical protein
VRASIFGTRKTSSLHPFVCTEPLPGPALVNVTGGRPDEEDHLTHLREAEIAAFLDEGLEAAERHRVEAHIDICEECRAELVDIGRAMELRGKRATRVATLMARRWWIPAAAAAGIVAILVVPRLATPPSVALDSTRAPRIADGEGQRRIDLISPADDATMPSARMVFTWHAVRADVYRVSLLTASGDSIWTKETTDTTASVPTNVTLSPGPYFWRVDAVANGIVATTRVHRLNVAR